MTTQQPEALKLIQVAPYLEGGEQDMNNVWDHVHLLQDLDPKLSHWFSTRLDAQQVIRRFFPYARSQT